MWVTIFCFLSSLRRWILSCHVFCSLQRCSYLHSLVCLAPQLPTPGLNKFQNYLSTFPIFFSKLQQVVPAHPSLFDSLHTCRLFLTTRRPVLQAFPVPASGSVFTTHTMFNWGELLFPQLFSATWLVSLSSPRNSKNSSGCCVRVALKRHLPDSVLKRKRIGRKKHSLSKPCHTNSIPALPSAQLVALSLASLVSNAVNQTWHSLSGCQRRGFWLGRKGRAI